MINTTAAHTVIAQKMSECEAIPFASQSARSQVILRFATTRAAIAPTIKNGEYGVNDLAGASHAADSPSETSNSGSTQHAEASKENTAADASHPIDVDVRASLSCDLARMDFITEAFGIQWIGATPATFGLRIHQEWQRLAR